MPFSPLGKGLLTGTVDTNAEFADGDIRATLPRYEQQSREAATQVVDLLGTIAERHDATPAQIALAWLLAQSPSIVPIPGTTKLHRLEENAAAALITLDDSERAQLTEASAGFDTSTQRYPEKMQSWIDR